MSPRPAAGREYVLTLSCPDTPGLVYAVSSFLVQQGGNISQSQQFDDRLTDRFFMRVQFRLENSNLAELRADFARVAEAFQMGWQTSHPEFCQAATVAVSVLWCAQAVCSL